MDMFHTPLPFCQGLTHHGRLRLRQRRLPAAAIDQVLAYGRIFYLSHGKRAHFMGHKTLKDLAKVDPILARRLRKVANIVVIIANDNSQLITAYRSHAPHFLRGVQS